MRDLEADWRRWTRAERVTATIFGVCVSVAAPALLMLAAV